MEPIDWIFFDLGGTLTDETLQVEEMAAVIQKEKRDCSKRDIYSRMIQAAVNYQSIRQTVIESLFETPEEQQRVLKKAYYRPELERLYPGVPQLLALLSQKYRLAVLANQGPDAEERLKDYGIYTYFSAFFISSVRGLHKPDSRLFQLALEETGCEPKRAMMVGDRLDNDIFPARSLGMHTVRVMQGLNRYQKPRLLSYTPEATIQKIHELGFLFVPVRT